MYKFRDIMVSKDIQINIIENSPDNLSQVEIFIINPCKNMQTDSACFESIALILKAKYDYDKIYIGFTEVNWLGIIKNLLNDQTHYMRFLYRLWKFEDMMDWVEIKSSNINVMSKFKKEFKQINKTNNIPSTIASFNRQKGQEHVIENLFVGKEKTYFKQLVYLSTGLNMECIFNQLPNGLFDKDICIQNSEKVCNKARIFPTGYFDIWGINEKNELCIFELKKEEKNEKMGIISELFFYALYAKEILLNDGIINKATSQFRGYPYLVQAVTDGCFKVNAYFLVNKSKGQETSMHKDIKENKDKIIKLLNLNSINICFQFIEYDYNSLNATIE